MLNMFENSKLNSFISLPVLAITGLQLGIIIILSIVILLLLVKIIMLLIKDSGNKNIEAEELIEDVIEEELIEELVKEELVEEVLEELVEEVLEETETKVAVRYNYSFKAHLDMAPEESIKRFLQIKQHILSYPDIKISDSWKFQRYRYGARTLAKVTLQGKTLTLYIDLDPKEFENTVYNVVDVSDKKSHVLTPMMFKVRGNRGVKHANELIDLYFSKLGVERNETEELTYTPTNKTREELVEEGLIKIIK